jgi:hypothetical protein
MMALRWRARVAGDWSVVREYPAGVLPSDTDVFQFVIGAGREKTPLLAPRGSHKLEDFLAPHWASAWMKGTRAYFMEHSADHGVPEVSIQFLESSVDKSRMIDLRLRYPTSSPGSSGAGLVFMNLGDDYLFSQ